MQEVSTITRVDQDTLVERAARAELRFSDRWLFVHEQPCKNLSTFDERTQLLTLRNVRGDLATYRYSAKRNRLTRIEVES
jgi:hypothetical protein